MNKRTNNAVKNPHVIFHVGYIKTATTFLQETVFSGQFGDLELAAQKNTRSELVHNFITSDNYTFNSDKTRKYLDSISSLVRNSGKTPVWSEEMLLGNPPSSIYDGFCVAKKIKAVYPEAKILITIREQKSIALSIYKEYVLGGGRLSIKKFIGPRSELKSFKPILRREFLLYDLAIKNYIDLFGRDNVLVLPQEMLFLEQSNYMDSLRRFTASNITHNVPRMRRHVSEGYSALNLRRYLNRLIVKDPNRPGRYGFDMISDKFIRLFDKLSIKTLEEHADKLYRDFISEIYCSYYIESNLKTCDLIGIDLGRYGYETS